MLVHRRKRPGYTVQPPLTSLVDIVFLLLIYFLLTTNFISDDGIDVKLPRTEAAKSRVRQDITVFLDIQGQIYLDGLPMTLNELSGQLQNIISESEDRMVVVKADGGVLLDKAVSVMDVAKAAGASRLCLATENEVQQQGE